MKKIYEPVKEYALKVRSGEMTVDQVAKELGMPATVVVKAMEQAQKGLIRAEIARKREEKALKGSISTENSKKSAEIDPKAPIRPTLALFEPFREQLIAGTITKTAVAAAIGCSRVSLQMFIKYHNLLPLAPMGGPRKDDPALDEAVEKVLKGGNMTLIAKRMGLPLTTLSYHVTRRKRAVIKAAMTRDPSTSSPGASGQTAHI